MGPAAHVEGLEYAQGKTWRDRLAGVLGRLSTRPDSLILGLLGFAIVLAIWEAAVRFGLVNSFMASSPSLAWEALVDQWNGGIVQKDAQTTLFEFLAALVIATVIGIPLGMLSGWYNRVEYAVDPFIWFLYNAPILAFYPLFMIWLGLGTSIVIAMGVLFAIFPIYANAYTGIRQVDPLFILAARSFGASQLDIFVRVALPASVPSLVTGLHLGVGRALLGVISGELFGTGTAGLGTRMNIEGSFLHTSNYFASLLVVILLGTGLNQVLKFLEGRVDRWRTDKVS